MSARAHIHIVRITCSHTAPLHHCSVQNTPPRGQAAAAALKGESAAAQALWQLLTVLTPLEYTPIALYNSSSYSAKTSASRTASASTCLDLGVPTHESPPRPCTRAATPRKSAATHCVCICAAKRGTRNTLQLTHSKASHSKSLMHICYRHAPRRRRQATPLAAANSAMWRSHALCTHATS
jgi:hypothetical protein